MTDIGVKTAFTNDKLIQNIESGLITKLNESDTSLQTSNLTSEVTSSVV